MDEFQEPVERPAEVSREYVVSMLSRIFDRFCPHDLLSPWVDYLESKGVLIRDGASYVLAGNTDALADIPADAQASLYAGIVSHARSHACPRILLYAIPGRGSGGSGGTHAGLSGHSTVHFPPPSQTDYTKKIELLLWDRERHLKELAGFGPHAPRMFDWIIRSLGGRKSGSLPGTTARVSSIARGAGIQEQAAEKPSVSPVEESEEDATAKPKPEEQSPIQPLPVLEVGQMPARAVGPLTARLGRRRPTMKPEAIDATAKGCLKDAMEAAKAAGELYLPSRADIARAVSSVLGYEIRIHSLFATKATPSGRAPRYPGFIEYWQKLQEMSAKARSARRSRG